MRIEVRSFQLPRWLAPLMGLLALAVIPVAFMVAILVGALAVGTTIIRALLPFSPPSQDSKPRPAFRSQESSRKSEPSAIDVEYEVKDQK